MGAWLVHKIKYPHMPPGRMSRVPVEYRGSDIAGTGRISPGRISRVPGYVRPILKSSAGSGSVEYGSDSNDPRSDNHQESTQLGKSWA